MGLSFPPANCYAFVHMDKSDTYGFESLRLLTRAYLAFPASVVLSERVVPDNSRSSYSRRVFELGRIVSLMTARLLVYPSSLN